MFTQRITLSASLIILSLITGCSGSVATPSHLPVSLSPLPTTAVFLPHTSTPKATPTPTTPPSLSGAGGGRIVYSAQVEDNYELYIMNANGTDQRRLTWTPGLEEGDPDWSPAGERIAYSSSRESQGEVKLMDPDGGGILTLTQRGGGGPAWSPDGTILAFTREIQGSDIYLVNAGGGGERQLTFSDIPGSATMIFSPNWSPDGKQIVCVVDFNPDQEFFGNTRIYILDLESSSSIEGDDISALRPLPSPGDPYNDHPSWSPDGSQIAFSAVLSGHRDLFLVNSDGTDLQQLTFTEHYDELSPSWSPDGSQIVFQANPEGNWDIFVIDADGGNLRQLTSDPASEVDPDWGP